MSLQNTIQNVISKLTKKTPPAAPTGETLSKKITDTIDEKKEKLQSKRAAELRKIELDEMNKKISIAKDTYVSGEEFIVNQVQYLTRFIDEAQYLSESDKALFLEEIDSIKLKLEERNRNEEIDRIHLSFNLIPKNVHPSWSEFLTLEREHLINKAALDLFPDRDRMVPAADQVLRFFETDLSSWNVVILGSAPSTKMKKEKIIATGRAYEVNQMQTWGDSIAEPALKNIVRAIYKTQTKNDKTFAEIKKEIKKGSFEILPPHQWFDNLEQQGAIFFNGCPTGLVDSKVSHKKIWDDFLTELFAYIEKKRPEITWLIWGNESKTLAKQLLSDKATLIYDQHPTARVKASAKQKPFYQGAKCFKQTKSIINWLGQI